MALPAGVHVPRTFGWDDIRTTSEKTTTALGVALISARPNNRRWVVLGLLQGIKAALHLVGDTPHSHILDLHPDWSSCRWSCKLHHSKFNLNILLSFFSLPSLGRKDGKECDDQREVQCRASCFRGWHQYTFAGGACRP